MDTRQPVKIRFRLMEDETGWPPVESEGIWAEPLGHGYYRLDNIPWFVPDVGVGDIVVAEAHADGKLWAVELVRPSDNCTIRVIPLGTGTASSQHRAVLDTFEALGAGGEGAAPAFNLVALTIPSTAPLAQIKAELVRGEADGSWVFEEARVTDAWMAAES